MKSLPAAIVLLVCPIISIAQDSGGSGPDFEGRYEFRSNHDPNGIGKFYMDREIAQVMGFAGAGWLERKTREQEERLSLMVRSLKLKAGDVVADIGAGSGVISMLMAQQILPRGKVMAVDIQNEMLLRLRRRSRRAGIRNIKPVKGTIKSPNLKPESVDLAIMVDVYHEFEFPYEMMLGVSRATKIGGRVVLVEYRMEDPTVPIKLVHKMTEEQAIKELRQPEFSLKWTETVNVLPWQHILVFTKQKSGT
ncbi:MAG: class I SAM-dependent methyltransferase [Fuerstiella sp.]|nr:class I SAM-dependent methyltransferase [Fuerstiella sp.]